jgi:hypothetical protein
LKNNIELINIPLVLNVFIERDKRKKEQNKERGKK